MAIQITGKFKPDGNFPLMDAADIEMPDGSRLPEYVDSLFIPISQADYDALVSAGTVDESKYYMIEGDNE